MTPQQFLSQVGRTPAAPAYLFLGPEGYSRRQCRAALIESHLPTGAPEDATVRHDLDDVSLEEVLDDARCLSLFASQRFLWVDAAEAALPKGRNAAAAEAEGDGESTSAPASKKAGAGALAEYLKHPTEGTVLVFNCQRYDLDGEDKAKAERVRKFFAGIPVVEFPRLGVPEAKRLAQTLGQEVGIQLTPQALDLLVEATAADALRLAAEVEKLRLYAGEGASISEDQIAHLVPSARSATVFQLVNALAQKRRDQALDLLDTLVSEGEYLPLVLTFLATNLRLALVAREERLRSPQAIQSYFTGIGVQMWWARAQQVQQTMTAFSKEALENALAGLFEADRGLREPRPDDRVVMERLVLRLTC